MGLGLRNRPRLLELGGLVVFCVSFAAAMMLLELESVTAALVFDLETDQVNQVKVYWRSRKAPYAEEASAGFTVTPEQQIYRVQLDSPAKFRCLRLDPGNRPGYLRMSSLQLQGNAIEQLDLMEPLRSGAANSLHQLEVTTAGAAIEFRSTGDDPYLELCLDYGERIRLNWQYYGLGLVLVLVVFGFLVNQKAVKGNPRKARLTIVRSTGKECGNELLSKKYQTGPTARVEERGTEVVYQLELLVPDGEELPAVVETARLDNPGAEIHIQLGRAGETF